MSGFFEYVYEHSVHSFMISEVTNTSESPDGFSVQLRNGSYRTVKGSEKVRELKELLGLKLELPPQPKSNMRRVPASSVL